MIGGLIGVGWGWGEGGGWFGGSFVFVLVVYRRDMASGLEHRSGGKPTGRRKREEVEICGEETGRGRWFCK